MRKIKLPKDEAAHRGSEWWYFNGHLKSKNKEFGFMIAFLKMDMIKNRPRFFFFRPLILHIPMKIGYLVHSHVSDLKKKKFYPFYKHFIRKPYEKFAEKKFLFTHYRKFAILKELKKGVYHLNFKNKQHILNLIITAKKPPVLHNKKGIISIGKGYSYYYSFTNMDIKGAITINNKTEQVKGTAWMDHQWGNFVLYDKQWDWLSIKLNNNTEIMTFKILDKATQNTMFYASLIDKKGKVQIIKDAQLNSIKNWKSKKTERIYPIHWNLKIPSKRINLTIKPVFNQQEMSDGILKYWEGSCIVTGIQNKKRINGKAYMELVGHEKYKSKLF